ncbi:AAA family ATPase [Tumebacillus flagellatus]|uniref:ATPase AAA-type core domain-containing protein n=1 Tax=Tumebacillus flagellatus TaxID=1157490 RepID=A0A074LVM2_9BACL|nr:ATP-binding protein [Tumebacillus flagellatus]KEO85064.1 hypothetical protein EL26_00425 [Tumebacillus flagellatus]
MIKEIRFRDWKSFEDSILYLDPLTVLVGTNASGKSNVVDGLLFLHRMILAGNLQEALEGNESVLSGIRGGMQWAARQPGNTFLLEVLVEMDEERDLEYSITISTEQGQAALVYEKLVEVSDQEESEQSKRVVVYEAIPVPVEGKIGVVFEASESIVLFDNNRCILSQAFTSVQKTQKGGRFNTLGELFKNLFVLDPIPSHMRNHKNSKITRNLNPDASNVAGVLASLPEKTKQTVEQTLSKYLSHLPEQSIKRVFSNVIPPLNKEAQLLCEEVLAVGQKPLLVDADGMSDGTLRFLGILTALLTRPEGSLIVIEKVDNGLHPSRAGLLLQMLREIGKQRRIDVLVTTHNPALLDALGPKMIPFVMVAHRDTSTGWSVLTLLEDLEDLPKLLAMGTIGKLMSMGEIEKSLKEGKDRP